MRPETRKTIRSIVITDHTVLEYDYAGLKAKLRYLAYAEETCPTTGKKHLQGFAYAWKPMRFAAWKKLFPGAHVEEMRGCFRENSAYCSKEGNLVEFGEKPNENGKTCVVNAFMAGLTAGKPLREVATDADHMETYCRYRNGIKDLINFEREKEILNGGFLQPELYIRIGPAGTGKSRWVFDKYGYANVTTMYTYQGGKFFVPCNVTDVVLFDDVQAGSIIPLALFKSLTDGHPKRVETKGGEVLWRPKVIVFTSNSHPFDWWPNLSGLDKEALERRITKIEMVE